MLNDEERGAQKVVWIIFFAASILLFLLTKSYKKWSQVWYAGTITLAIIYAIDAVLIKLGAFSYKYIFSLGGGVPLFYWLSSFFGGMVLVRYYPKKSFWKFPYVLLAAFIFLVMEFIIYFLGYIRYHNWTPINSFFLDVGGFIIVIWLWNWINEIRR